MSNKKEKNIKKDREIDLGTYVPESMMDHLRQKGSSDSNYKSHQFPLDTEYSNSRKGMENILFFLVILMFLVACVFFGYTIIIGPNDIKQLEHIINSTWLLILSASMMMSYITKNKKTKKIGTFLSSVLMIGFISFNLLLNCGIVILKQNDVMKDFTGKTITEAMAWAEKHNITINQTYDNSEVFETYDIIKQDVYPNTLLKNVKEINFVISDGPDYEKEVSITDMTGWNIDEAVKIIDENFLNHVTVEFEENKEISRDTILSQSKKGIMKRNEELILKVSLGTKDNITDIDMINLKKMTEFKALLWLKRNDIPYEIKREFSDTIAKGKVICQDVKTGTTINHDTTVHLTISRGKKIIVPDLTKMNSKNITNWIVKNKLKVEFEEKYDTKIKKGNIISTNYNKNDEIEEGTTIHIVLSKGKLILPGFSNLDDFRNWAKQYNILYREEYKQDKNIKKGEIIGFSAKEGDSLDINDTIVVYISSGTTTVIPNFVGMKKADIEKKCQDLKIQCTFYYAGTSTKARDIALNQNKKAGSEVLQDTYVNIGLSTGKKNSNNTNVNTSPVKPTTPPPSTPTPTPSCKQKTIYLNAGGSVDQTKAMIKNQNPDFKFNFVTGDPGYGTNGSLYAGMFEKYQGKTFSTCDTITIYIVSR